MYNIYEELRNERKMRDIDVAREANIPQATLSRWKHGMYEPKYKTISKIAKVLGVKTSVFYEGGEE